MGQADEGLGAAVGPERAWRALPVHTTELQSDESEMSMEHTRTPIATGRPTFQPAEPQPVHLEAGNEYVLKLMRLSTMEPEEVPARFVGVDVVPFAGQYQTIFIFRTVESGEELRWQAEAVERSVIR
jgi:hypothetical protein